LYLKFSIALHKLNRKTDIFGSARADVQLLRQMEYYLAIPMLIKKLGKNY